MPKTKNLKVGYSYFKVIDLNVGNLSKFTIVITFILRNTTKFLFHEKDAFGSGDWGFHEN